MRISFIWQGFDGKYGTWNDGLYAAMKLIEKEHEVQYLDTTRLYEIEDFKPDFVLYWESPSTFAGKDRINYWNVQDLPYRKALLFAGGPVKAEWLEGFDLFFVESELNEQEFEALGKPWKRAFGVNTQVMQYQKQPKVFHGTMQATCASWKRPWLLAEALHDKALIFGRYQESDPIGFMRAREQNALVLPEQSAEGVASLLNASHTIVNCSEYWGGGQRCTLEAMACGVFPIVMDDSPKNIEYVRESGFGSIVKPEPQAILDEVNRVLREGYDPHEGIKYIHSKYTEQHYADALLKGLKSIK